ncbi:MAG: hypothetical protein HXX08_25115, partial [Chloroflexi bacterium]|nr:hypothetical protein [Chloroflexota bacterium]
KILASGSNDGSIKLWSIPDGKILTALMDLAANTSDVKGVSFKQGDITYTLPCGSAIPAGAVCTCNCVAGTGMSTGGSGTHYWYPN